MQTVKNLFILIPSNVSLLPIGFSYLLSNLVDAILTKSYIILFLFPLALGREMRGEET